MYFNDVDVHTWKPFGVRADPTTGGRHRLDGTVYMISPDGEWSASPCLLRMAATQAGYGVVVPRGRVPRNRGASEEDGIFLTSTSTGRSRLLASIGQILRQADPPLCPDEYRNGDFYGFHVKWNPQGTRLLFVLRWLPRRPLPIWPWKPRRHDGLKNVITMDADGKNIRVAISAARWSQGGHHPNWCPDGEHVLMNLNPGGGELRFVRARYDGSTLDVLAPDVCGSGHPTMHPDGQHILTDAYPKEPVAFGDGTVPLRWIDLRTSDEKALVRIRTRPEGRQGGGVLRVDPHPAWDASYRRIAFNACPGGRRQVFVADIHE